MNTLFFLFFLFFFSCKNEEKVSFIFEIENPEKEKIHKILLSKYYHFQEMEIIENSLDDTCLIGIMKIAPFDKGKLYKIEFMSDTIPPYSYFPYKNKKGKLIIKHSFFNINN